MVNNPSNIEQDILNFRENEDKSNYAERNNFKNAYSKSEILGETKNKKWEEQEPNEDEYDNFELDKSDKIAILGHRLEIIISQINYKTQELIEQKCQNAEREAKKQQIIELIKQKNEIRDGLDDLLK